MENLKRIEWVDYYKAIAILLVVIGHATGRFNGVIYQFHVAAFFFISGYLSGIEKKSYDQVIVLKFFNLLLPYIFYCVCGVSLFAILQHYNVLKFISAWGTIPSWTENIKHIFSAMYCDWLGATWFLTSLFFAYILSKICLLLDKNRAGVVYILSVLFLYNMGYYYHNMGINSVYFGGIAQYCIIQLYFSAGHLYRRWGDRVKKDNKKIILLLIVINITLFAIFKKKGLVMDLASTSVNTPIKDMVIAGNGICFLICISKLLERIRFDKIKEGMRYIGKNTFGILIYHFFGFKIASLMLSAFGVCGWQVISLLCPPAELADVWWPLYLVISVAFSMLIWHLTTKIQVIKFMSGLDNDRYKKIYKKYEDIIQ